MNAEEEARAAAYRARIQGFERQRLARETALAGSAAELADLKADWAPLLPDTGFDPVVYVREPSEAAGGERGAVVN